MEILHIENLSFAYPQSEKNAVENLSLCVNQGEFIVVFGESGCGKSTLLRLIKKELSPYGKQSGRILYDGVDVAELDGQASASQIGFIQQNPESQIVTDSVWHELAFGLESLGCDSKIIRARVAEMASYFGIGQWFHKKTAELSGGQRQLLNLASVMAMQPKVLLLDEPTAQLDPIAASNFISTLYKLNRETNLTVIIVEHRLEEVFSIADKVLLMNDGRIQFYDTPNKIGEFFSACPDNPMQKALPSAMRIFSMLEGRGESPLNVREGRRYITQNYSNRITKLDDKARSQNTQTAIELKEVFFRYKKDLPDVLNGASLEIFKGEHFCILGSNGSGKTTALNILSGIIKPYAGAVLVNGKRIDKYAQKELYINNIALLPQNPQTLFLENTLNDDLHETCNTLKYSEDEAKKNIAGITQMLGISQLLSFHPYDLSGGEQQKSALAKILLLNPKILLLDEPTKGIDSSSKESLLKILSALKNSGVTIITVTHDVEFAALCADRVGMLFDGQFVSIDTPESFFSQNCFYTTAASRISNGFYDNAVLCEQVAQLCRLNSKKGGEHYA